MVKKGRSREYLNSLFNSAFALLILLTVLFLHERVFSAFILLIIFSAIALIKWKSKITLIVYLICGIIGPLAESIAIQFGIWSYSNSSIFDVPLWLFPLWGAAGVFIYQTSVEIRRLHLARK